MGLFSRSHSGGSVARVSLSDAEMLSDVGSSLCARTAREARKFPGDFLRPVVGDASYFARQAQKVFGRAVKEDKELERLYLHTRSLSSGLERATRKPYTLGGPAVDSAVKLVGVTEEIQAMLQLKELGVDLSGVWLSRAQDISAFALRIIATPPRGNFLLQSDEPGQLGRVYPGVSANEPVNSAHYWLGLQANLVPVVTISVPR